MNDYSIYSQALQALAWAIERLEDERVCNLYETREDWEFELDLYKRYLDEASTIHIKKGNNHVY